MTGIQLTLIFALCFVAVAELRAIRRKLDEILAQERGWDLDDHDCSCPRHYRRADLGNAERHAQESWRRQIISDPALPPKAARARACARRSDGGTC
jgi:hypothetical protein